MRQAARGFTLIEMMIVVSILILVAAMMVPMLSHLAGSNRAEAAALEIQSYMMMARQRAVESHKDTAAYFVAPSPSSAVQVYRVMLIEAVSSQADLTLPSNWQVVAGSYGAKLPAEMVVHDGFSTPATTFAIHFDARGMAVNQFPHQNFQIYIGPRAAVGGANSKERTIWFAVNKATGGFLRFTEGLNYQ
jgi:prepilin-type N-terminal cleavage/methylation domain-containing protein